MVKSVARTLLAIALAIAFLCQGTRTLAGTTGGIQGVVSGPSGNPLSGVSVSAVAPSYTATAVTAGNGFYAMLGLPPDTYSLTFARSGLQTVVIPGQTVTQDLVVQLSVHMQGEVRTLATIPVRAASSLVQPKTTADVYSISPQTIQNITGTPLNVSESAVLNSLPGITTDRGGYPLIRGGLENDEGYQLEGIPATEPITGQFINSLSNNGVAHLAIFTGGYDASNGNTNSGVVNEVVKRGSYPGAGEWTIDINSPNFDHRLVFDYGNATPDNRLSYYFSFSGLRQFRVYGDQHTFFPFLYGAVGHSSGNDDVANLFFRFGRNNSNELQFFGETGANLFEFNYENGTNVILGQCGGNLPNPNACFPYDTANLLTQTQSDLCEHIGLLPFNFTCGIFNGAVPLANFTTLFPGQVTVYQPIGYPDAENNVHFIEMLNFKHQFGPAMFAQVRTYRTSVHDNFLLPWDGGAFAGEYEHNASNTWGVSGDFDAQLNSKHELSFGAETDFTRPRFDINIPTLLEIFTEPLESTGCMPNAVNAFYGPVLSPTPGGCYISPLNAAANQGLFFGTPLLPTSATVAPLSTFPDSGSAIFDNIHQSDVWIKDRWAPSDRWTVTPSLRFDQQIVELPANAQALSGGYVVTRPTLANPAGIVAQIPAAPIGTDITRPSQVSPRLAVSYQVGENNVLRASYGRFIEFAPTSDVENAYAYVPTSLQACSISSGCFTPLPGYDPACVNGQHGASLCNNISNLYDQTIMDLNQNDFAQFTPVRPQKATAADFSWEHNFPNGFELKITPYWRKGTDYIVANTPLLFTLADGTPVFGAPHEENSGVNVSTGVEFALQRNAQFGWSGFINGTYDNTLANYNSDFFPVTNAAALALNHFFHVSYLAPITATGNINYHARNGWFVDMTIPFESGYRYGVGKKTYVFLPTGPGGALVATQVLNTDIAAASLGLNANTSAYYFTDPVNPGTLQSPNVIGSRGTADGDDPGTIKGIAQARVNVSLGKDMKMGGQTYEIGLRVTNVLGNYTPIAPGGNSRYRNNGFGAFSPTSGTNSILPFFESGQFPHGPFPFEYEQTGNARLATFYVDVKY